MLRSIFHGVNMISPPTAQATDRKLKSRKINNNRIIAFSNIYLSSQLLVLSSVFRMLYSWTNQGFVSVWPYSRASRVYPAVSFRQQSYNDYRLKHLRGIRTSMLIVAGAEDSRLITPHCCNEILRSNHITLKNKFMTSMDVCNNYRPHLRHRPGDWC